ncbi:MAG: PHP domain-containing protein [bacterium]|nr:PHP domain-containing protein [bacterium]
MRTSRNMTNLEVAKLLRAVAAALTVKPDGPSAGSGLNNRFRIIAYERAADAVEHATSEVKDLWEEDKLREVAGIGEAIADHLDELFKTGKVEHFETLMKGLPPGMFELLDVPGIGAKSALKLTKELGITKAHGALERMKRAAEKGHIQKIEGFGEQSEKEILASIKEVKERTRRLLLPHAASVAGEVLAWLRKSPIVARAEPLGSLRREVSTVGDVDIAVATNKPKEVIEHFGRYPKKVKLLEAGEATSSLLLPGGVQLDLMVQPVDAFGALLQHFTGSKHHNIALRSFAIKKGLSLSEYGIRKLKTQRLNVKSTTQNSKLYKFEDEEGFYKFLGLEWIPPELREDNGEIEAALTHKLPKLVELTDIRGDFHVHSNFPPETSHDTGADPMVEYVAEADRLGYEYICFTEHNPKVSESEKKILDVLKRKKEKVEQINYSWKHSREKGVRKVFNGLEIDIRPDGALSLPEAGFDLIDFAIVSIHGSFRGSKEKQTARVLKALAHPKVKILGHPTGRKLNEREGVDFDWEKIFEFCKEHNKWLEINSWPERLDLPDILVHEAVKQGVKLTIDTDSHAVSNMRGMCYGVSVARRGWAEKKDIVNTLPLSEFEKLL